MIKNLYFIEYSRQSIFQTIKFLKLNALLALLLGRVYCGPEI